ncbi:MAG: DNA polymerase III subunit alpha [Bacilli bacterium]|nr:DNA polymerase III subunit alpha [Bacilli bacterium]
MSKFAPLHIISGYSFLRSGLSEKKIESIFKSDDYFGYGLTDEGVMHGFPSFAHLGKQYARPLILGMSVLFEGDELSLFVLNEEGYHNLIKISLTNQKNELNYEFLKEHNSGLLCVLETNHGLFKEKFESLEKIDISFTKYVMNLSELFPTFYLGIEVTNKNEVAYANKVRHFANEYTYSCVAFPRIRYLKKEDAVAILITQAIQDNETLKEKSLVGQEYFLKESDYHKIYREEEIDSTNKIIQLSSFDFFKKRGEMLHFSKSNSDEELKNNVYLGLEKLGLKDKPEYIDRANYELSVIQKMGYSDYFLLVQDFVAYAKNNGILVGAGRGSSAGSLVAYALNIIEVDPIKYGLLFERFLNPSRSTMPDIDVDFVDNRRDEVIQYTRDKYGKNRVGRIVAMQVIKAKQALRDVGRVYEIPERHISLLSKNLDSNLTLGQSYRLNEEFKKLCDSDDYFKEIVSLAGKIEGLPRQSSLHASGVVLNNVNLEESMPVSVDFDDNFISQYEFNYMEEQGFLKMDFLGITNLSIISHCVDLVNAHYDVHLDKQHVPYDEKEIYQLMREGHASGLFQIDTELMRRGLKIINPQCFEDVIALLALNRPGPMRFLKNYALRRDGKEKINYVSEDLKEILGPTYGIIIYQEQIIQIAMKMANMSPDEADLFRKAISKKEKDIIAKNKKAFIEGALKNGYSQEVSEKTFENIARFAEYGFNKSHSVVYAMLTCQMAYLKVHYPLEFYSAVLEIGGNGKSQLVDFVYEMRARGLSVLKPSINHSSTRFEMYNNSLLFPFTAIHGLASGVGLDIIKERNNGEFKDFFDFVVRMYAYKINENQINALINAGAFDELYPSRASLRMTCKSALQYAELNYSEDGQLNIGISPIAIPAIFQEEDRLMDNLQLEHEALGMMLTANPLDLHKEKLLELGISSISDCLENRKDKVAGIVRNIKNIKTKKGEAMVSLSLYDNSGEMSVTVFPKTFDAYKGYIVKNNMLIIKGYIDRNDRSIFIADEITPLENE